jgi:hypothetical protein
MTSARRNTVSTAQPRFTGEVPSVFSGQLVLSLRALLALAGHATSADPWLMHLTDSDVLMLRSALVDLANGEPDQLA